MATYSYGNYPDELKHCGVIGMKWGMHKAAKRGEEYHYKSMVTKHDEKKAAKYGMKTQQEAQKSQNRMTKLAAKVARSGKHIDGEYHVSLNSKTLAKFDKIDKKSKERIAKLEAKQKKYESRAEKGREWDKLRQDYAKNASTGAAIARKLIMTPGMDRYYQNQRSKGKDVANAAVTTYGRALVSGLIGIGTAGIGSVVGYAAGGYVGYSVGNAAGRLAGVMGSNAAARTAEGRKRRKG